jgi:hypothetical protein
MFAGVMNRFKLLGIGNALAVVLDATEGGGEAFSVQFQKLPPRIQRGMLRRIMISASAWSA